MTSTVPGATTTPGGGPIRTAAPADRHLRRWYAVVLLGGVLGIVTSAWQTVERIHWAANPAAGSICEINSVLSCSSVFSHWQSSALGIPNSLIAMPLFGLVAATGLAGVLGSRMSGGYLGTVLGLVLFFAGFITWYLEQSAFSLHVLCLFCVACGVNAIIAGIGITRVAAAEGALGKGRIGWELKLIVEAHADLVAWIGLALVNITMLYAGLGV